MFTEEQRLRILAGALESEGYFRDGNDRRMDVVFTNTDIDFINFYISTLDLFDIGFSKRKMKRDKDYHKECTQITISNGQYINRLYNIIHKYMQCRIEEFQETIGMKPKLSKITSDKYWLLGIVEGEGSLTITKSNSRGLSLRPVIDITNTNKKICLKTKLTLCDHYIVPSCCKPKDLLEYDGAEQIRINDRYFILKFLNLYENLWISNKRKRSSELLKRFCEIREYRNSITYNAPYSEEELKIYEEVKLLGRKRHG